MALADDRGDVREFRIEGISLWFAGGVLAAALIGAFLAGRWVGAAGSVPPVSAEGGAAPGAPADVPPEDLSFFDTLSAPGQQAEPGREASRPAARPDPAPALPTASPGAWFVQIGALRDRQAAELLVRSLGAQGLRLRVDTEREGARGVLYKVRVGGYPSREAAESAAADLRKTGQGGAFVVRAD